MTYKDALQQSMETFMTEAIEYKDPVTGKTVKQEPHESLPIVFGSFIRNMAAILLGVSDMLLLEEAPSIYRGDEKISDGAAVEWPNASDYIRIFTGGDLSRGIVLSLQMQEFIEWLLKADAEQKSFGRMWYDYEVLVDKWNEFVKVKNV